jgi:hypothetical protein
VRLSQAVGAGEGGVVPRGRYPAGPPPASYQDSGGLTQGNVVAVHHKIANALHPQPVIGGFAKAMMPN